MEFDQLKTQYLELGERKFYNKIMLLALDRVDLISNNLYKGTYPHIEYIKVYDKLYLLYKQEGDDIFLNIAKLFRKASNKIYRTLLKKKLIEKNNKFFNLI